MSGDPDKERLRWIEKQADPEPPPEHDPYYYDPQELAELYAD